MKILSVLLFVSGLVLAQDPTVVTIEYDDYGGYGAAPLYAISVLWPACTIESFNGNPNGWADAVDSETSIAIGDMHNYALGDSAAFAYLTVWYNDPGMGPMFYDSWQMGSPTDDDLTAAMGIAGAVSIPMPPIAHYCWDPSHPISEGITDWSYVNPGAGYGTGGHRLTVSSATPITGWTAIPSPGQAALCAANDGCSIVTGYWPSLNTSQAFTLWLNILEFMWEPSGPGLTPMTWGSIKTLF